MRDFIQPPKVPLSQPGDPQRREWNPATRFFSAVFTLLVLAGLLYGGALVLSRTAGCAEIIQGKLEKYTALSFKIGSAALTPSLDLVLTDVKASVPKHPLGAGVDARRVVIQWRWGGVFFAGDELRELRAEGVDLHFGLDTAGQWQPAQFGQVSRWLAARLQLDLARYTNLADRTAASAPTKNPDELDLFGEERVQIEDALVHWQVVTDSEIARIENVSLISSSVNLPNRKATHLLLNFRRADTAQGFHSGEKQMELLDLDGRDVWISGVPTNVPASPRAVPVKPPEPKKVQPAPVAATVKTPAPVPQPVSGTLDPLPQE